MGITELLARVRAAGRTVLHESEGRAILHALDIATPATCSVTRAGTLDAGALGALGTEQVVVKVVSAEILHKTDAGGIAIVPNSFDAVLAAIGTMNDRLAGRAVEGYSVSAFVPHSDALGAQLLIGMRWTQDFGPIVTLGPGGIHTEFLARHLEHGRSVTVLTPALCAPHAVARALERKALTGLITGRSRGGQVHFSIEAVSDVLRRLLRLAQSPLGEDIEEFEINPLVATPHGPVALDVLVRLRTSRTPERPPRPLRKLRALLQPQTAAVIGVSERRNPGRVILENMLAEGFPRDHLYVVKPGTGAVNGVRCCPDLESLPAVDLIVLSIPASQVPSTVQEIVVGRKAESIIVIPGGLGERSGTAELERRMIDTLQASRQTDWQGPVMNGGNSLGIQSIPGRYDATFIPVHKLRSRRGPVVPLAVISQSGAFAIARLNRLSGARPRYMISAGNQTDLTVGDYLRYLKDEAEVEVFACYVEGFQTLDGLDWLEAAADISASGRDVILYRAGRTSAGARASASHTAAIAGDYAVTRELAESAGVLVADSLADFDDLIALSCYLRRRPPRGWRLAAVSNAGFECVAMADRLGRFQLAQFSDATLRRLEALFARARIEEIVDPHNPVDLTPLTGDEVYAEAVRAVFDDPQVDVGIVGCVPLTAALTTLPAGGGHDEDLDTATSIGSRLSRLAGEAAKPWVAVVDGGPQYDRMAERLGEQGVPTFRTADRALRLLESYCARRLDEPVHTPAHEEPRSREPRA